MAGLHLAATGTWNSATDRYDPAPLARTTSIVLGDDYDAIMAQTRVPSLSRAPSALGPAPSALGPAPSALGPAPLSRAPSALGPAPSALGPAPSALGPAPSKWPSAMDTVD
jgi:hypothetical protein